MNGAQATLFVIAAASAVFVTIATGRGLPTGRTEFTAATNLVVVVRASADSAKVDVSAYGGDAIRERVDSSAWQREGDTRVLLARRAMNLDSGVARQLWAGAPRRVVAEIAGAAVVALWAAYRRARIARAVHIGTGRRSLGPVTRDCTAVALAGLRAWSYLVLLAVWHGSFTAEENLSFRAAAGYGNIACVRGVVSAAGFSARAERLVHFERPRDRHSEPDVTVEPLSTFGLGPVSITGHGLASFRPLDPRVSRGRAEGARVIAPVWLIVLGLVGFEAMIRYPYLKRVLRKRQGRCTGCGYDLRASPGCCPECGQLAAEGGSSGNADGAPRLARESRRASFQPHVEADLTAPKVLPPDQQ